MAAAELGVLAGADRVEGTLFGNGERTGNVDIVTLALNLYTQGIDPGLDFSNINAVARTAEACNQLPIHPRHPYVGDLVFTAFSGSHQDAIKKGFAALEPEGLWDVPYLPIDPADVGRTYESIIRVNSQSGKGGIAYLLERDFDLVLPRRLQIEFSRVVQERADATGKELSSSEIGGLFEREYLAANTPYTYQSHQVSASVETPDQTALALVLEHEGETRTLNGLGSGPIDAMIHALRLPVDVVAYEEHSVGKGSGATAVAYVEISTPSGRALHGVGKHSNIITASVLAIMSAVNRAHRLNLMGARAV